MRGGLGESGIRWSINPCRLRSRAERPSRPGFASESEEVWLPHGPRFVRHVGDMDIVAEAFSVDPAVPLSHGCGIRQPHCVRALHAVASAVDVARSVVSGGVRRGLAMCSGVQANSSRLHPVAPIRHEHAGGDGACWADGEDPHEILVTGGADRGLSQCIRAVLCQLEVPW